jgi:hypothetical protein
MRTKEEIIKDPKSFEALQLEVLLDIREILNIKTGDVKKEPAKKRRKKCLTNQPSTSPRSRRKG